MKWPGAYRAVVLSATDPQGAGRVRLQVPQVTGTAGVWADPAQASTAAPGVGDMVWVIFQGGDASYPLYIPPAPTPTPPYSPPSPPSWQVQSTPAMVGLTLGNGSVASQYLVDGHQVTWSVVINWGSTTTASPTVAIGLTAPVTPDPASGMRWNSSVLINPAGGIAFRPGFAWMYAGTSTMNIETMRVSDLSIVPFSGASLSISTGGWLTTTMTYDKA